MMEESDQGLNSRQFTLRPTRNTQTHCGQNAEICSVEAGAVSSDYLDFKSQRQSTNFTDSFALNGRTDEYELESAVA